MTKHQKAKEMGLTGKERRFAEEYLVDFNATQAATRAGYQASSNASLRQTASKVLAKPHIQEYLDFCMFELQQRNDIQIDEIIQILGDIIRFDVATLFNEDGGMKNIHEIPVEARRAIEGIESYEDIANIGGEGIPMGTIKKLKTGGRLAAIEKMMRYLGSFQKDNEQQSGGVTINEADTVIFRDFSEEDEVDS